MSVKKLVHLEDVFPRVCDATNKGMESGWYFEGTYFSDLPEEQKPNGYPQYVIDYVMDTWGQTMEEFWKEIEEQDIDEYYYTDWLELEDCEDVAYLADGTVIEDAEGTGIYKDEEGNEYIIVE